MVKPKNLQEVLDRAAAGAVVRLEPVEYVGGFAVTKPVELVGPQGRHATLVGTGSAPALIVRSKGVKLTRVVLVGAEPTGLALRCELRDALEFGERVAVVGPVVGIERQDLIGRGVECRDHESIPVSRSPAAESRAKPHRTVLTKAERPENLVFTGALKGLLRAVDDLGGAVPDLLPERLRINVGDLIDVRLEITPLDGEGRPLDLALRIDGAPAPDIVDGKRQAPAPRQAAANRPGKRVFRLRGSHPWSLTPVEGDVNGIPVVAAVVETAGDATYVPPQSRSRS